MNYGTIGKWLLGGAVVLAVLGALLLVLEHFGVTRLPGDITWRGKNVSVYVPIGLMILVSIVLTVLLNILFRR